jgi:hypothetical protein
MHFSLKSEIEEGFIAQKTCDGKPYLHSGTAKTAVPPVGMTNSRGWRMGENPTSAKLDSPMAIVRNKTRCARLQLVNFGIQVQIFLAFTISANQEVSSGTVSRGALQDNCSSAIPSDELL